MQLAQEFSVLPVIDTPTHFKGRSGARSRPGLKLCERQLPIKRLQVTDSCDVDRAKAAVTHNHNRFANAARWR